MASFLNSLTTLLCYTSTLRVENNYIVLNNRPRGSCLLCCPMDERTDINYIFYSLKTPGGVYLPQNNPVQTAMSYGANPNSSTIIYLHGFSEKAPGRTSIAIRDAYLSTGDYNFIMVNWGNLVGFPWYGVAVKNTRVMGNNLAKFLMKLDSGGLPLQNVHVIGFSLGAEAAGFAGKNMPPGKKIPRITGLDPAFPLFSRGRRYRLADGDADFVDVIHTDAGMAGYPTPMGDADFYPNGGLPFQPGCRASEVSQIYGFNIAKYVSCSHQRAWQYYAESVRSPRGFPATRCPRWEGPLPPCAFAPEAYMGARADNRSKGRFYLQTNPSPPFSRALT